MSIKKTFVCDLCGNTSHYLHQNWFCTNPDLEAGKHVCNDCQARIVTRIKTKHIDLMGAIEKMEEQPNESS